MWHSLAVYHTRTCEKNNEGYLKCISHQCFHWKSSKGNLHTHLHHLLCLNIPTALTHFPLVVNKWPIFTIHFHVQYDSVFTLPKSCSLLSDVCSTEVYLILAWESRQYLYPFSFPWLASQVMGRTLWLKCDEDQWPQLKTKLWTVLFWKFGL